MKEYYNYLKNIRVIVQTTSGGFIGGSYTHPIVIRIGNIIHVLPLHVYVPGGTLTIDQGHVYKLCIPAKDAGGTVFDVNTETVNFLNISGINSLWICGVEFSCMYTFSNDNIYFNYTAKSSKVVNCFEYFIVPASVSVSPK